MGKGVSVMSSIGSMSNKTSSSVYGSHTRYTGLMSGLDTDEIVKGMTMGTTSKINKQYQSKQLLGWKMDAIRGVSNKLVEFTQKYMSYTSSSNMLTSKFFARNQITTSGTNNKYISATGTSPNANNLSISAVEQMAKDTTYISETVSSGSLTSGEFDLNGDVALSKLSGQSIEIQYGNSKHYITLDSTLDYSNLDNVVDNFNKMLSQESVGDGKTLADQIQFGQKDGKITISAVNPNNTNTIKIVDGSEKLMDTLGLQKDMKVTGNDLIIGDTVLPSKVDGKTLKFEYDGVSYDLELHAAGNSPEDIQKALNDALANTLVDGSTTEKLSDKVHFNMINDRLYLEYAAGSDKKDAKFAADNDVGLMKGLGFTAGAGIDAANSSLSASNALSANSLMESDTFMNVTAGKSMSFTYNGVSKSIKLPSLEDVKGADGKVDADKYKQNIQKQLNDAFGKNRVRVDLDTDTTSGKSKLSFTTTNPAKLIDNTDPDNPIYETDTTSVLKVTTAGSNVLGNNGAFKMAYGTSTHVNLDGNLRTAGFKMDSATENELKNAREFGIVINGKTINSRMVNGKEVKFDRDTSISDIIKAINESDAGVKVSYLETTDKFTIVSTDPGASGEINITAYGDGTNPDQFDLGKLFAPSRTEADGTVHNGTLQQGQDAIIYVDYDGEGGQDPVKMTRSSNTFNLDGLSVTVSGTFGMEDDTTRPVLDASNNPVLNPDGTQKYEQKVKAGEAVTFSAKADTENIFNTIKEMITAYNEIVDLANTQVSQKRNRDYAPLTDEQKEQMSESDIERWEEKAKEGMLFNDSDLRNFTTSIRSIFSGSAENMKLLAEIGITTSSVATDNGKVVLDEAKLKAALEERPEDVEKLFSSEMETKYDANGKPIADTSTGGIMAKIKNVFDKFAKTEGAVKGIFIERAGSKYAPLSMLNNSLQKQMDDIDDIIDDLKVKLTKEQTRYYNQFTQLEKVMAQWNSQAGWLTQQTGQ